MCLLEGNTRCALIICRGGPQEAVRLVGHLNVALGGSTFVRNDRMLEALRFGRVFSIWVWHFEKGQYFYSPHSNPWAGTHLFPLCPSPKCPPTNGCPHTNSEPYIVPQGNCLLKSLEEYIMEMPCPEIVGRLTSIVTVNLNAFLLKGQEMAVPNSA